MNLEVLLSGVPHEIIQVGKTELEGALISFSSIKISSVTIDSRQAEGGTLFICLQGLNVDGHNFIAQAAEKGATAILVEKPQANYPKNVTVVQVQNTRWAMAYVAANYYNHPANKLKLIGITGTNGKTTTTYFVEEILRKLGRKTGLIGTVGAMINGAPMNNTTFATSTTPDPLELHEIFAKMLELGVEYVVMEVSSHALALHKMEGLTFDIGVFTNLTQDHLDFHGTMENYRLAKAQLFAQSKFAVVNIDDESTPTMLKLHGNDPYLTYGIDAEANLVASNIDYLPRGTDFTLTMDNEGQGLNWETYHLPVSGKFNVYNILAAIGTVLTLGGDEDSVRKAVSEISGVPGRIQSVPNNLGVQVFVDYAHSPDSLEKIITSVREFTKGRVITLFGCGGDRDIAKRPMMGRIAGELSDYCIITSDNPRTEDPMVILAHAEVGIKETKTPYEVCENRGNAISNGIKMLKPGDAFIITGKGHEDYQEIGNVKYPFSDYDTAVSVIKKQTAGMNLTIQEITEACNGTLFVPNGMADTFDPGKEDFSPSLREHINRIVTGVSTDSRSITKGSLFVPIVGGNFDGHNYIVTAAENGAACALTENPEVKADIPLIIVKSTRRALMDLASYYRHKHNVTVVAITGSAGKTTTKDMIYHILSQKYKTKKTLGNFNNDIGLPLSIFQLEPDDEMLVLEMGMNHAMEIHELSLIGAPDIAVITHIGDAHIENFENREGILHAKLEIVDGLKPNGTVILNGDDPLLTGEIAASKVKPFIVKFPSSKNIVSSESVGLQESFCHFNLNGHDIKVTVPLPGSHMVMNALLATAVGLELGVAPTEIAKGFDDFIPPSGRLSVEKINDMTIINDAYNANPASMRESLKILSKQPTRKVAILGDMNELGHVSYDRHTEIGAFAAEMGIDLFIAIGPQSKPMYDAFDVGGHKSEKFYFLTVQDFLPKCREFLHPGDTVIIKASRGMAFEQITKELGMSR